MGRVLDKKFQSQLHSFKVVLLHISFTESFLCFSPYSELLRCNIQNRLHSKIRG